MDIPQTTILLIEDDEEDVILLQRLLARVRGTHYHIIWEPSFEAGLTRMLEGGHDLCLVDYQLGARNGILLIKQARKQGYGNPIVLLTGIDGDEIDIQALQAGADDYIAKAQLQSGLLHRIIRYAVERKRATTEREKLLSEQVAAKELEKKRNEFVSIVVHELKTPLTSLKGYAQLLHKRASNVGDEQTARLAMRLNTQINKLTDLINDLRDVTSIEGGTFRYRENYFAFDALVEEQIEAAQLTTEQQTIRKEGQSGQMVWGDRERIGQVITNLLTNAIKYAPNSDTILTKVSQEGRHVKLCVQDFGPGIPQEQQARIFDPFYRVEGNTQVAVPGLGLGLYISAEIIRRQEGQIWVESKEGEGSTFCFTLPIAGSSGEPAIDKKVMET